ncbi:GNAT family N-acetyltransferase [Alkaliphilus hydrothermalis]|uniref:GNAT superfamily N-acetyltransferase n=1 Tax=Alkaliphilus hydrothermalis TaxID=1482730 RepID=A0ABS2NSW4_9FIRM|nr:GNAT family N-acetyltransferase [Alkaliphilus hydrothermalis]MBM7616055.1 GNAT superfamily N-acetyltransferase [Alkaliphilus hydrothermalis]
MKIHYEVISQNDISTIKNLCNELMAYQQSKAHIHPEWFDNMSFETRLAPSVKGAKENFIIIAKDGDVVVGYAYSNITSKYIYSGGFATLDPVDFFDFDSVEGEDVGCLSQFYIKDEYRGAGIGSVLFERSMDWLKSFNSIKDFFIFVSNGNDGALKFYQNKGFSVSHQILDGFITVLKKIK